MTFDHYSCRIAMDTTSVVRGDIHLDVKLSDAEFIVLQILWREGELRATEIADIAREEKGWKKNTVYTLINRLIKKGAVRRSEPSFLCSPAVSKSEIRLKETDNFLQKMYGGSLNLFVKSFLAERNLSREEFEELKRLIEDYKEG